MTYLLLAEAKLTRGTKFSAAEVNSLREQLQKIEDSMEDGKFIDEDGKVSENQEDVKLLLHRCWRWTEIVLERSVTHPLTAVLWLNW